MLSPFTIGVYDVDHKLQLPVRVFQSCDVTPRFNGRGSAQLILAADDPANAALAADGARVIFEARDEVLLSGYVAEEAGTVLASGDVSYQIVGDDCVLDDVQAFIAPGRPIAPAALSDLGQAWQTGTAGAAGTTVGQTGYYVFPAGVSSAEAAIKDLLRRNIVERLGLPYVIGPNLERGGDARAAGVLPALRMGTLREAVDPLLEWSGLGLRIWQEPGSTAISIDVYEPRDWTTPLTTASGIVTGGDYTKAGPTTTRMLLGGPGDLADRDFRYYADQTGLEARYGRVIETFKDSTSATMTWPEELDEAFQVAKYYLLRGDVPNADKLEYSRAQDASAGEGLREGRPAAALGIALAETESFQVGGPHGVRLGDRVVIETAGGQTFHDHIESTTFAAGDGGFKVTPSLGSAVDDEDAELWRAIERLARALRTMSTRK
jgi:hypothetical protein